MHMYYVICYIYIYNNSICRPGARAHALRRPALRRAPSVALETIYIYIYIYMFISHVTFNNYTDIIITITIIAIMIVLR